MNRGTTEVYTGLKRIGVDMVASLPCVNLRELLTLIDSDKGIKHVPISREEEGIGICAGAFMGGMKPAILMQNSGLGNSINALASLDLLYGIPVLMIVSHRGVEGEEVSAQVPMGNLTGPFLRAMGIPTYRPIIGKAADAIREGWERAIAEHTPVAILLDISFWRSV
jgi:sulfopyruvate decarboxylase subunit alpha